MHELSIALTIIDRVQTEMSRRPGDSLKTVGLRIGALSAVDPEALAFSFTAASRSTPVEGARLNIEWVPASILCHSCGHSSRADQLRFVCTKCGSTDIDVQSGYELDITYLEV
ncbi:MAG: hydrogenase maturation nickel metallochaperone HypA [Candidatus Zixiibacteriota bacterium]